MLDTTSHVCLRINRRLNQMSQAFEAWRQAMNAPEAKEAAEGDAGARLAAGLPLALGLGRGAKGSGRACAIDQPDAA